jgi:hypothetical protein
MRFEVLRVMNMFRYVLICLQTAEYPDEGGNKMLRNAHAYPPKYVMSQSTNPRISVLETTM